MMWASLAHPEQGPLTHLREEKETPHYAWGCVNGPSTGRAESQAHAQGEWGKKREKENAQPTGLHSLPVPKKKPFFVPTTTY